MPRQPRFAFPQNSASDGLKHAPKHDHNTPRSTVRGFLANRHGKQRTSAHVISLRLRDRVLFSHWCNLCRKRHAAFSHSPKSKVTHNHDDSETSSWIDQEPVRDTMTSLVSTASSAMGKYSEQESVWTVWFLFWSPHNVPPFLEYRCYLVVTPLPSADNGTTCVS